MAQIPANTAGARQVELIIRRLNSLSTLPAVAAQFLSEVSEPQVSTSALAQIIESDPALTAKILSLAVKEGLLFPDEKPSVKNVVAKLPASTVRNAVLSVKVFQVFENNYDPDLTRALPRKQLALHALAVACCASNIAEIVWPGQNPQSVFSAGLLHDIGKLALDEVMPKSFERITKEAKLQNACMCGIEQKYLGLDHTILGKRLAEKWNLPQQIVFAIWLHHSDTQSISKNTPAGKIAEVVQLADLIARQCGIGQSGSFDTPSVDMVNGIAQSLSLTPEQTGQIRRNLPDEVAQRAKLLALDSAGGSAAYCNALHNRAVQLAQDSSQLSLQNRQLASNSAHFDFARQFFASITSGTQPIDMAANFAVRWQKFYQTGPICLYLIDSSQAEFFEAVIVNDSAETKTLLLNAPTDTPAIPTPLQNKFAILNAHNYCRWLFEQVDIDFNSEKTKVVPLLANGKAIGGIVFELRYPVETDERLCRLEATFSIAACFIALALAGQQQEHLSERFAELLGRLKQADEQLSSARLLVGLAEMASGAAHELNNPLAVISGRAQLLANVETDVEKKQMLQQIKDRTDEISQIIQDLMNFAKPQEPKPTMTSIPALLDEAIRQTAQKHNLRQLEVQKENIDEPGDCFVDAGQITSAIANILSNALESYPGRNGPTRIIGSHETGDFVQLQIIDSGCGMDAETLQKTTQPFFSDKPAGRGRGMGLAHAQRLVHLNKGSLHITSQPDSGTTVTILLPRRSRSNHLSD